MYFLLHIHIVTYIIIIEIICVLLDSTLKFIIKKNKKTTLVYRGVLECVVIHMVLDFCVKGAPQGGKLILQCRQCQLW